VALAAYAEAKRVADSELPPKSFERALAYSWYSSWYYAWYYSWCYSWC
jgi:hypothetical protein